jgi:hypothetical protein
MDVVSLCTAHPRRRERRRRERNRRQGQRHSIARGSMRVGPTTWIPVPNKCGSSMERGRTRPQHRRRWWSSAGSTPTRPQKSLNAAELERRHVRRGRKRISTPQWSSGRGGPSGVRGPAASRRRGGHDGRCRAVLTQNLHPTSSTQQAEQAGFTREQIPRRASQCSLKINKRQSS